MTGLLLLLGLASAEPLAWGRGACPTVAPDAPPQATVITTSAAPDLFTAFGHSALRLSGGGLPAAQVLDWGTYQSGRQDPVVHFLAGTLDYSLEAVDERQMHNRARFRGRSLVAQRLALPPEAAQRLHEATRAALGQEDRRFRYHWLRDNCATRIRDALDAATGGALRARLATQARTTPRREVLRHLASPHAGARWWGIWLGWHTMASAWADQPLDAWDASFMPDRLRQALAEVDLTWPDGTVRPLVAEECVLRRGPYDFLPLEPVDRDGALLGAGLGWAALIGLGATRARLVGAMAVATLAVGGGLLGALTAALAASSTLEGLTRNHAWWVVHPATVLLLGAAFDLARGRASPALRRLSALLAGAGVVGLAVRLAGLTEQDVLGVFALFLPPLLATALVLRLRGPHG